MKSAQVVAGAATVTLLAITACGTAKQHDSKSGSKLVNGRAFTMAVDTDLGSLNPYTTVLATTNVFDQFLYDSLTNGDAAGNTVPNLAQSFKSDLTTATFVLKPGITCPGGETLKASDVAAVFNWVATPANKASILGQTVQVGTKASADDATRTVTVHSGKPDAFLLDNLGSVPIACRSGLANPKLLAAGKAGTGQYAVTEMVSGDHYTLTRRPDYDWGPGDWKKDQPGLPVKLTARVLANATTTANLLLSGELNYASISGPDQKRVAAQKNLLQVKDWNTEGELYFNQADGHPGKDPLVRKALTMALDLNQIGKVLTSGEGKPLDQMLASHTPEICPGNTTDGNLPGTDVAAAKALLDQAGWLVGPDGTRRKNGVSLSLGIPHFTSPGQQTQAVELIQQQLKAVGAKSAPKPGDGVAFNSVLTSGGWDLAFVGLTEILPTSLVPFFSGPNFTQGGNNIGSVHNAEYDQLVKQASSIAGKASCPLWNKAESALIKALDVVPFYLLPSITFGNGATFSSVQFPWSIRMTAN